jgi:hypothetical protein
MLMERGASEELRLVAFLWTALTLALIVIPAVYVRRPPSSGRPFGPSPSWTVAGFGALVTVGLAATAAGIWTDTHHHHTYLWDPASARDRIVAAHLSSPHAVSWIPGRGRASLPALFPNPADATLTVEPEAPIVDVGDAGEFRVTARSSGDVSPGDWPGSTSAIIPARGWSR